MMTTPFQNDVLLEGQVLQSPVLSHENHGLRFYRFPLEIPRLSGQSDILPILVTDAQASLIRSGDTLRIHGQLRSFNNRSGTGNRLVLTVYAQSVEPGIGETENRILLCGALCKPLIFRRTPLGRSICDLMLAVPRRYGRADYLPVIAWGQLAVRGSELRVGDEIALEGRVQSRAYHKVTEEGTFERVAYEVSMMHLLEDESEE